MIWNYWYHNWNPVVERARTEVLDLIYLDNIDGRWLEL